MPIAYVKKRFGFTFSFMMHDRASSSQTLTNKYEGMILETDFQCGGWLCSQESVTNMKNVQRMGRRPESCPKYTIRLVTPRVKDIIKILEGVGQMVW